jgi:hypothetical protein
MSDARTTLVFVDAIENGVARLLAGDQSFTVPASLLPDGAREGSWVSLEAKIVPAPPGDAEAIRKRLAGDDPGGDVKL